MFAVITGATGLVGSNLAIALLGDGHRVRCVRRATSRTQHLDGFDIEWVEGDLGDEASLRRAFNGADAVFHCAAAVRMRPHPDRVMISANIEGTQNVLNAFRATGSKRLVHCSSVVAIGLSENAEPIDETARWNMREIGMADGYSVSKYESEMLVRAAAASDVDAVIVNPTYMLGPFDPKPSSGALIIAIMKGQARGYPGGYNNFVDVRDVCRGMIAAYEKGRRGESYILGGYNLTYREAMGKIASVAGAPAPKVPLPKALARLAGWGGDLWQALSGREVDINTIVVRWGYHRGQQFRWDKARDELGYNPGPLEPAIRDAIDWFRSRAMI